MKPASIIIGAMLLTEVGTNIHALFPPTFVEQTDSNGLIVQVYNDQAIDPWTVRMVSLSLASAFMLFLLAWVRLDTHARNYMRAWGLYFVAQAAQKAIGHNIASLFGSENDWGFDLALMGIFIGAAYLVNRFSVRVEFTPQLRIVWSKQ